MRKQNVLFISTKNSCRSQIAEAYLNALAPDRFHAESAGLVESVVDMNAIQAMKDEGIDMSGAESKTVYMLKESGKLYSYIISTCGKEILKDIPIFPGSDDKICWHIQGTDYSGISPAQKMAITKKIRDEIRFNIIQFINLHSK